MEHIQIHNPLTNRWVKVDRASGAILGESKNKFAGVRVYTRAQYEIEGGPEIARPRPQPFDPLQDFR